MRFPGVLHILIRPIPREQEMLMLFQQGVLLEVLVSHVQLGQRGQTSSHVQLILA